MIKLSQPKIPELAISRVSDILRSGQLVYGAECLAFEKELAEYLCVKHVLVVSNGTAALHVALLSLGIGQGDAVIVPDFTFVATANVVEVTGAKAIIVDVEPSSYNMCPNLLEEKIKSWTGPEKLKAIMPVLEFGNPSNLNSYRKIADKYDLKLIEDAACALGASDGVTRVGSVGDFGCFSFHPRKTLTTGEGGAIATNDDALFNKAILFRNHGMKRSGNHIEFKSIGLNYRLTDFQAAIGRSILPELNNWIVKRRRLANQYAELLSPLVSKGMLTLPNISEGHSVQTYMVVLAQCFDRGDIIKALREKAVESNLGAQSMSSLGLFHHPNNAKDIFVEGPHLYSCGLALPLHENMKNNDVEFVVNALIKVLYDAQE